MNRRHAHNYIRLFKLWEPRPASPMAHMKNLDLVDPNAVEDLVVIPTDQLDTDSWIGSFSAAQ